VRTWRERQQPSGWARLMLAAAIAMLALAGTSRADTPVPKVSKPLPSTAGSYPFGAAAHQRQPQNLRRLGYLEQEYLVRGRANVYDWPSADTGAVVRTPNVPYVTRMLVRRPAHPREFSGTVWVEMQNPSNRFDLNLGWALAHRELVRDGDAWVGITAKPVAIQALQNFDPARYGALSFANPLSPSDPRNCTSIETTLPGDSSQSTENGLVWDIYSQVSAWLRSHKTSNPLRSEQRKLRVYGFGYSQTGGYLATYIGALHQQVTHQNGGRPPYDGYVVGAAGGAFTGLVPINQCSPAPPVDDPRYAIHNLGVPVIRAMTQSDYLIGIAARRPDSDRRADRYRHYELAGAPHATAAELLFSAAPADITRAGVTVPSLECDLGPRSPFPDGIYFDAILRNLDSWVRRGIAPPPGREIAVSDTTAVVDSFGNAVGGVRSPYVDVPTSTWLPSNSGPTFCGLAGLQRSFPGELLQDLYATHRAYVRAVTRDALRLERKRYLTSYDARQLIRGARRSSVP
jgi:hypothetical protein